MTNIFRVLVLIVTFVLGLYLMVTMFLVFALLAALGFVAWLCMRIMGKTKTVDSSSEGVTIEYELPNDKEPKA